MRCASAQHEETPHGVRYTFAGTPAMQQAWTLVGARGRPMRGHAAAKSVPCGSAARANREAAAPLPAGRGSVGCAAVAGGPRAYFWTYSGAERDLQQQLVEGSKRTAPLVAARVYEDACAAFGVHTVNVSGNSSNCFFHAMLHRDAQRRGVPAVANAAAAEALRRSMFARIGARLQHARAAGGSGAGDVQLLTSLFQVCVHSGWGQRIGRLEFSSTMHVGCAADSIVCTACVSLSTIHHVFTA